MTAVLVVALQAARPASRIYAVGAVDQQQTAQASFTIPSLTTGYAQTFTAGVTGDLDQVELALGLIATPGTVNIEILSVVAGAPIASPALSTTVISTASLTPYVSGAVPTILIPLSTSVPVIAGNQYAVAVRAGSSSLFVGGIIFVNVYAGGQYFFENPTNTFTALPNAEAYFKTFVTPAPTATITRTPTATSAALATATATPTATVTPGGSLVPTGTALPTSVSTAAPTATAPASVSTTPLPVNDPNNDDEQPKETSEQRQQRQHTNSGNRDDVHTEGQVVGVEMAPDRQSLLVTIALGPGGLERLTVQVPCPAGVCPDIRVGDDLMADGYQNGVGDPNSYFVAPDGVTVWRNGRKNP